MDVQLVLNGSISLILIPKNEMEEKVLDQLATQENEIKAIRGGVTILGKAVPKGLVIAKKDTSVVPSADETKNTTL